MAVNVIETETKYDAPADVALPTLDGLPQVAAVRGPDELLLEADYYDTDDLRLQPGAARWPALKPSAPAGQVVLAYLRAQAEALTSLDSMVRRDEPDSVHKMRVVARRLRSTLRSFGHIIRDEDTRH